MKQPESRNAANAKKTYKNEGLINDVKPSFFGKKAQLFLVSQFWSYTFAVLSVCLQ